jgi:hypothetical protein
MSQNRPGLKTTTKTAIKLLIKLTKSRTGPRAFDARTHALQFTEVCIVLTLLRCVVQLYFTPLYLSPLKMLIRLIIIQSTHTLSLQIGSRKDSNPNPNL